MASDFSSVNLTHLLGLDRVTSTNPVSDEKKQRKDDKNPSPQEKKKARDTAKEDLVVNDITNVSLTAVQALIKEDMCRVFEFYDDIDPQEDDTLEKEATQEHQNIARQVSVYEKRANSGAGTVVKQTPKPFPFADDFITNDDQTELFSGYEAIWDKIEILRINGITHIPHNSARSVYESIQVFLDLYKGRL